MDFGGVLTAVDPFPTGADSVKVTNEVILPDQRFDIVDAVDTLTVFKRVA